MPCGGSDEGAGEAASDLSGMGGERIQNINATKKQPNTNILK